MDDAASEGRGLRLPHGLVEGDRVALVAPAGPAPVADVARAVATLTAWGLVPVAYPSLTAAHERATYLSGADAQRAADVEDAWCDPAIAGIFCVRGGYGTVRILDLLDVDLMGSATAVGARPKPVLGSSDITALHEWLRERLGVATWFTPMLATSAMVDDDAANDSLRRAVTGDGPFSYRRDGATSLVRGRAEGPLIGGNLSLLAMTLSARSRPPVDNTGCLVMLEDVAEDTYRIDGFLQTLVRSGWFDGVTGIVGGSWLDCGPAEEIRALLVETFASLGVPIVWELGFGHGPAAPSVPLGVPAVLDAGDDPVLTVG